MIVIAKPRQFTIVNAVPRDSREAFLATKVENRGESAITTNPQNIRKQISKISESSFKTKGDNKQQIPESNKAEAAVLLMPDFSEI